MIVVLVVRRAKEICVGRVAVYNVLYSAALWRMKLEFNYAHSTVDVAAVRFGIGADSDILLLTW